MPDDRLGALTSPLLDDGGEDGERRPSQRRRSSINQRQPDALSDENVEALLQVFAEEEGNMTWSRIIVEKFLADKKWYNPNAGNPDAPSLSKGWAFFEHFTLPRRFATEGSGNFVKAPPGETRDTRLYSVFATPQEDLSDWGIGMGMYFSSLQAVIVFFILAGLFNIPNILFYGSDGYDHDKSRSRLGMLQYSAVCTDREWVVCADGCASNSDYWNSTFANEYYGTATDANTGQDVTLISRTICPFAEFNQGMINYGTLMFLIICMAIFMWYMSARGVRFDEDNTTASDYSLVVHNPPPDAVDPDEWRDFFDGFSDNSVTLCTVGLNNDGLLAKLVQRRKEIKELKRLLPTGYDYNFDDESEIDAVVRASKQRREEEEVRTSCLYKVFGCAPLLRSLGISATEDSMWKKIKATTEEIKELQQKEYEAAAIYVTFETERGQRMVLESFNASEMEVLTNKAVNLDSSVLFRGRVLRVEEASEPSTVRWLDLRYSRVQIYLRMLITFGITMGLLILSAFILHLCRVRVSTTLYSIILSVFNSVIPIVVRILVSFEKHYDDGDIQCSLYIKVAFFRWVNTVLITRMITPFVVTLGEEKIDMISTVQALMISEMLVSPILRYFDFSTILKRHYLAPRAKTEEELLSYFGGGWYNLAERFTDFTKVLLLCTCYAAFYPLIYFLGALILLGQYWMDKFLLLRSWQKAPSAGTSISRFSRRYFNKLALLLGAISSAYAYARSPFTQLCSCSDNDKDCILPDTQDFTNVKLQNGETVPSIQTSEEGFYFCKQDAGTFPPTPHIQGSDKWMTQGQEHLSSIYGWTCLILLILYCVFVLGGHVMDIVLSLFKGVYEPSGTDQNKDFSSGIGFESFGYIPQLEVPGFHFPLLASSIDGVDVGLIGWKDPNSHQDEDHPHRSYDDDNLIFDVPHSQLHRSRNAAAEPGSVVKGRPIFSVVKHYPPKWDVAEG